MDFLTKVRRIALINDDLPIRIYDDRGCYALDKDKDDRKESRGRKDWIGKGPVEMPGPSCYNTKL